MTENQMPVRFYRRQDPYGEFSNFARISVTIAGVMYKTVEHFYQHMKFVTTDPEYAERICRSSKAGYAARLGRDTTHELRSDWEEIKDDVMRIAVLCKFAEHQDAGSLLLSTGVRKLIEATTDDHYWGEGYRGDGKNMLGVILEETRKALQGPRIVYVHRVNALRIRLGL